MSQARYNHYVVIPTPASFKTVAGQNLTRELTRAIGQANLDIKYLKSNAKGREEREKICPVPVFTGVQKEAANCYSLANMQASMEEKGNMSITISSHGNPGYVGIVRSPEDRLDPLQLVKALKPILQPVVQNNQELDITFRACNTAYVQFSEDKAADQNTLLQESYIGKFSKMLAGASKGKAKFVVTGFRGYYLPSDNTPELAADYEMGKDRKKNKKHLVDTQVGRYSIKGNSCLFFAPKTDKLPNNAQLDDMFEFNKKTPSL